MGCEYQVRSSHELPVRRLRDDPADIGSPTDGIGVKRSRDLKHWRDEGTLLPGRAEWPSAEGRLTAGIALDLRDDSAVGKTLMFFHGSHYSENDLRVGFDNFASVGIAWSEDLKTEDWPRQLPSRP
jgi:hypothetical protein